MTSRRLLLTLALFMLPTRVDAQPTHTLVWDFDRPTTEVATYTQTIAVDGQAVTGPPTCTVRAGASQQTTCQLAIPALAPGPHTLSIVAERSGVTAETRVTGLNPSAAPANALNPRVTVVVTITIP